MSLKARIEAVIYAAEEPVTLAQLAALFAQDLPGQDSSSSAAVAAPDPTAGGGDASTDGPAAHNDHDEQAAESSDQEVAQSDASADGVATESSAARKKSAAETAGKRRQRDALKAIVDELIADYNAEGDAARGMEIREVAGGYRMATRPEYHDAVRGFIKGLKPPLKLSLPALETLAVIAYKQPVTAPEIADIRGVDSGGVLGSLLTRKLIATAGRKPVIGRPILYKTTREFLLRFGLKDVSELPSLEEFQSMAAEISEVEDAAITEQDTIAFAEAESGDVKETEAGEAQQPDLEDPREPAEAPEHDHGAKDDAEGETDSLAVEVEDEQARP